MRKILFCFFCLISYSYSIGDYFIEEFADNSNKWYINSNKNEDISIKNGHYLINNLDQNSDLSLVTSSTISDFFVLEYILKEEEKEDSIYGVFVELESLDRFYLILDHKNLGYFYEKNQQLSLIDEFKPFPYLYNDYNSIVLVKDLDSFTFLINEVPTEKIWTVKGSKITKIGIYLNNSANISIDRYTEFSL